MVAPSVTEQIENSSRGIGSLEITKIEPVITRTPMSMLPSDEFIEMPPIGFMYDRVGIGRLIARLTLYKFYQQIRGLPTHVVSRLASRRKSRC